MAQKNTFTHYLLALICSQFMLMSAHANDILSSSNNQPVTPANEIFTTIFTKPLNGTNAELVFDFNAGNGHLPNSVTITNFMTDGIQSQVNSTVIGDVTGNLSSTVTLNNTQHHNEVIQPITLGNTIGFSFETTNNNDPTATIADAFSVYLLDANGQSLFTTTDKSGANSLLTYTFDGGFTMNHATADISNPVTWAIAMSGPVLATPLPGALWLFATAFIGFCLRQSRRC
ncbi:NF038129 family PEP-CTERM protein [Methylomonas sp. AM2-LC]|uniref:NF038129 family PEP-CTERM protein n=1 Tax=Methylomonas sp. AM2-LC TaxID=3153301 RepID=UPI003263A26D